MFLKHIQLMLCESVSERRARVNSLGYTRFGSWLASLPYHCFNVWYRLMQRSVQIWNKCKWLRDKVNWVISHRVCPAWTGDWLRWHNLDLPPNVHRRGVPTWYEGLWLYASEYMTCTWNNTCTALTPGTIKPTFSILIYNKTDFVLWDSR